MAADERHAGCHYLNSGCWTEKPCSFVGVQGSEARLYDWDPVSRQSWVRGCADPARQQLTACVA